MNPNVSNSGVAKGDDWDQHWSDFSRAGAISPSMTYRCRIIRKLLQISPPGRGVKILELGSGTGNFAADFIRDYPEIEYLGLDMSATGVRIAKERVPAAEFRQRDLLKPASVTDDIRFGATHAICSEVLEHVDDPETLVRNALPYMAPGCRAVFTVPGGPMSAFQKHIGHRMHYTAAMLRDLLTRAGLEIEWASGVGFPFYNLYLSALVLSGEKATTQLSGEPGFAVRATGKIFDALFHLNTMCAGWQIAAVARRLA